MHSHAPEKMYIVRPQYEYGMYKVTILTAVPTRLQLPSRSRRVYCHYSTSDHHVQRRAARPHLLCRCRATQSWGVQLVTKNDEGVKWNRLILHWPLTHYYTACMFHAHFMHYTESNHQKLGGPIHCWSPQPKSWGDLSPPVSMVVAPMLVTCWWNQCQEVSGYNRGTKFVRYLI